MTETEDYDHARNSYGGQGVKSAMDEMEESPYTVLLYTLLQEKDIIKKSNICWT